MKKLKKRYQNITLVVITMLFILITTVILKINTPWYIYILVYFSSMYIGSLLFSICVGISIQKIQFIDSENDNQLFYCQLQIGIFGEVILIKGTFKNTLNLDEIEITELVSNNTLRDNIMPLYKNHQDVSLSYNVKDHLINIDLSYVKHVM